MRLKLLFVLSVVLCPALGQEFRGSLVGRVTDISGAVIPGVMVSAVNEATNVLVSTRSNEVGNCRLPFLLPANYRIVVELARFKKIEWPGIRISVASDTTLDFILEMGETTQTVDRIQELRHQQGRFDVYWPSLEGQTGNSG